VYFVARLLHTKPLRDGGHVPVQVRAITPRHFVLDPYPFAETSLTFRCPARHIKGKNFFLHRRHCRRRSAGRW
jgi:hypothetical protein